VTFGGNSWWRSSHNNLAASPMAAREYGNMGSRLGSSTAAAFVVMWMTWQLGLELVMPF
jgi:hypothetical protein